MFLKKFIIRNFRAIDVLELDFKKGLNIIIGENNSGKTAVMDALRLCLGDFQQPRDIYCTKYDFRVDKSTLEEKIENIEFDLYFECENSLEVAWFNSLHAVDSEGNHSLQLHFRYELVDFKSDKRVKRTVWGGENEGGKVPFEVRSALRNVYLGALKDANKNLRPNQSNILGKLYSNITLDNDKDKDQAKKDKLLKSLTEVLVADEWEEFIKKGNDSILEHLEYLFYLSAEKDVKIGFTPFEFDKFVQRLIMQLPVYSKKLIGTDHSSQQYFEIWQNGLGLNNLIYTAAVLGDIKQKKDIFKEEYNLLLIEEPEAHLHPQLQNTYFNYLKKLDQNDDFQIIVTSHSPTIAAKTDLNLLTILKNDENCICSTQICKIDLDDNNLKFLQKFLDVTKSQLFFANGVILVEGISEALLIPIFSRILGEQYDVERNGIEVVNINGVAFEHFAKLFNSDDKKRLESRCAIVTDDDEGKDGAEERVKKIEGYESGNLESKIGKKTFEYELFINNSNNQCLLDIIESLHPIKFKEINDSSIDLEERGDILVTTLSNSQNKSEFAYLLAIELEKDNKFHNFVVPSYIENAIKFVVDGSSS